MLSNGRKKSKTLDLVLQKKHPINFDLTGGMVSGKADGHATYQLNSDNSQQ
jgi:hypothetical protein